MEDALEVTAGLAVGGQEARTGFRTVSGPARATVLAVPQLVGERAPLSGESDLGYALLLVTLLGLGAAVALGGLAARSLAEPVGVLRTAAHAIGRGETPPAFVHFVPEEFFPLAE